MAQQLPPMIGAQVRERETLFKTPTHKFVEFTVLFEIVLKHKSNKKLLTWTEKNSIFSTELRNQAQL